MDKIEIVYTILRTGTITEKKIRECYPDCEDADVENYIQMYAMMDGQKAIMCSSPRYDDYLSFLGLADNRVDKEVSYLMEQDSLFGAFVGDRDSFDEVYDSGEYSRDASFMIDKQHVEIIPQEQWEALVAADSKGD
jgi:hypothetical protein